MDLSLGDGQEELRQRFDALFAAHSPPSRVRAAEPLGFDAELWRKVVAGGALGAALGEGGAGLVDLALVAETAGRFLAPVPLVECAAAARALARAGGDEAARWLAAARDDAAVLALALAPAEGGAARLVPAGAVADAVLALEGDTLVLASRAAAAPREAPANLGASPLADFPLLGGRELARGAAARALHARGVDEWRLLTAAALVGLAAGALAQGVEYVRRREQFGVAIGSFQSVQHRLADVATDVDGARLLAWEGAWAADEGAADAPQLAAMAFLFAARVARRAASESLHFHGGYGFTLELDIQLYFRRAKAWALALDDPRRELARLADLLYGPPESPRCTSA